MSRCVARWARNIESRAKSIQSEQEALSVANDLNKDIRMQELYGGDTMVATNVLESVALSAVAHLKQRPLAEKKKVARDLGKVLVNTGNLLIHDRQKAAWKDLPKRKQIRSANNILDSIELNANLLAGTMRRGDSRVVIPDQYICKYLQIRLQ